MKSDLGAFVIAAIAVAIFGVLIGTGAAGLAVVAFAILGLMLSGYIGRSMARPVDASWLPRWVVLGFLAKVAGTMARYYMVTAFYGGGDSYRYYQVGVNMAADWRAFHVPGLSGQGSLGTQVVESVTGFLFAFITPDMLGGFLLFAVIAYMGQLFLYAAFRHHSQADQLKAYAFFILFLPTFAFWPSSIGKDALVLLTLGASAYFVARSLESFKIMWVAGLGISLGGLALIRIHIAGLVVGALVLAVLFSKSPARRETSGAPRKFLVLIVGLAAALAVITVVPNVLGVDVLDAQEREGFTSDIVRRTSEKGTVAEGGPAESPLDLPEAVAHVLFRPFAFEASEIQHYLAAAETTLLALLTLWKLPSILRNLKRWRSNPYVVFSTFYVLAFAFAFSAVRNLGIIARQRGQVLAFFLVFLIALGWSPESRVSRPYREPIEEPTRDGPLSARV